MNGRSRIPIKVLLQYLTLYGILVAYGAIYEFFYQYQLSPLFHDIFIAYDPTRAGIYRAIIFLTPLAILPLGTKLRAAGQFIAGTMAIIIFIPIPIVFVPFPSLREFWSVYWTLWIGYFLVCLLSSLDIDLRVSYFSEDRYSRLLRVLYVSIGLALLYVLASNRVELVSLSNAHAARHGVTVSGLQGYLIPGYFSSFGGLLVAVAIRFRRFGLLFLALLGFLICYVTIEERTAAIMPLWLAYVYCTQRFFYRNSAIRFLLCVMAPFLILVAGATIIGTSHRHSFFYYVFTLATYRIYSIPANAFNVYYNYFQFNPHTYWSHINVVSKFVQNPYGGQSLPHLMNLSYHLGSYNASFLETDGLAAAGLPAVPWVCGAFGVILLFLNSCMRRLDIGVLALVTAGSSMALIDTGIGPGLLTNGLVLLALVLSVAPRNSPWARSVTTDNRR